VLIIGSFKREEGKMEKTRRLTAKEYLECAFESLGGIRPDDPISAKNLSTATKCCQELWALFGFPICPIGELISKPRATISKK
jgi:hypothetical protein